MLFSSTIFLQFFAAFLLLYFLCRNSLRARNGLIVAGSWVFYGWWDYRFLALLIFSGCFDFAMARLLAQSISQRRRKLMVACSVALNLSLLGFFKYCDFFIQSLTDLLRHLGLQAHPETLGIILPVGISFYTFQSLGYVIDVYRREFRACQNLLQYLAFVSFFPQLVAGPIQRARHLLPQMQRTLLITPEMLGEGIWLVLWGLFKKVFMADNLAPLVRMIFDHPKPGGPAVLAGALAFAFQIYGDFSGYSDIARGLGKILGFDLQVNFDLPYLATNLREFWRRWHISLSFWLRDYLYISLGGNRKGPARVAANVLLTMLLGGLWHGAAWNFVLWGAWHGLGLVANRVWQARSPHRGLPRWLAWPLTFLFVLYGWVIFRAGSWERVSVLTAALAHWTAAPAWLPHYILALSFFVAPLVLLELWQHKTNDTLAPLALPNWCRGTLQALLVLGLMLFWERKSIPFIYFQF